MRQKASYRIGLDAILSSLVLLAAASGTQALAADPAVTSKFPAPPPERWWGNVDTTLDLEVRASGQVSRCEVTEPEFMKEYSDAACAKIAPKPDFIAKIKASGKDSQQIKDRVELRIQVEIPSAVEQAEKAMSSSDFRLFRSDKIKCAAFSRGYLDPSDDPILSIRPVDRFNAIRRRALVETYTAAYNGFIVAGARYPYKDICTLDPAAPAKRAEILRYLAGKPALDDGTLQGAVRIGDLSLVMARARPDPKRVVDRDTGFELTALDWAIYKNRQDIAEAVFKLASDIPEEQRTGHAWTETPLIAVLNSGNLGMLDWVLNVVRPDPQQLLRSGYLLSLAGFERDIGYDATRKIAAYFLDHPKTVFAYHLDRWVWDDDNRNGPVRIVDYVLAHPRTLRECRDPSGGWSAECGGTLRRLVMTGAPATAKFIIDRFRPTPQQISFTVSEAISIRATKSLPMLLALPFDRAALKRSLAFSPVGMRVRPVTVATLEVPDYMEDLPPEPEKTRQEREQQALKERAATEAAQAAADRYIINTLLKAGFTRQEITGQTEFSSKAS